MFGPCHLHRRRFITGFVQSQPLETKLVNKIFLSILLSVFQKQHILSRWGSNQTKIIKGLRSIFYVPSVYSPHGQPKESKTCSFFRLDYLSQLAKRPRTCRSIAAPYRHPSAPHHEACGSNTSSIQLTVSSYLQSHCRHASSQAFKMKYSQTFSNNQSAAFKTEEQNMNLPKKMHRSPSWSGSTAVPVKETPELRGKLIFKLHRDTWNILLEKARPQRTKESQEDRSQAHLHFYFCKS